MIFRHLSWLQLNDWDSEKVNKDKLIQSINDLNTQVNYLTNEVRKSHEKIEKLEEYNKKTRLEKL